MQVETEKSKFNPVYITIESEDELKILYSLLSSMTFNINKHCGVDPSTSYRMYCALRSSIPNNFKHLTSCLHINEGELFR